MRWYNDDFFADILKNVVTPNDIVTPKKVEIVEKMERAKYYPKRILKSGPCTIVFWNDGTKTMVRRSEDEVDDDYSAFTAALAIKIFGSNSAVKRTVKNNLVDQIKKTKKTKNNS